MRTAPSGPISTFDLPLDAPGAELYIALLIRGTHHTCERMKRFLWKSSKTAGFNSGSRTTGPDQKLKFENHAKKTQGQTILSEGNSPTSVSSGRHYWVVNTERRKSRKKLLDGIFHGVLVAQKHISWITYFLQTITLRYVCNSKFPNSFQELFLNSRTTFPLLKENSKLGKTLLK